MDRGTGVDIAAPSDVVEHSRRVRARSEGLGRRVTATQFRVRSGRRVALEMTTAAVDGARLPNAVMTDRLERLSRAVGRSPVIEDAKSVLVGQYGISRGEAFALLTEISSRSNRKLRAVAEQLVEDQGGARCR